MPMQHELSNLYYKYRFQDSEQDGTGLGSGGDTILDSLPGWAVLQGLEPSGDVRPGLDGVASNGGEQRAVRKVGQVGEGDLFSSEVLLLGEDLVVNVELGLEFLDQGIENIGIRGLALEPVTITASEFQFLAGSESGRYSLLEEVLVNSRRCVDIEVGNLDGGGLFKLTLGLEVFWDQRGSLISEFLFDVASDGSALVDDISIIVLDSRNRIDRQFVQPSLAGRSEIFTR